MAETVWQDGRKVCSRGCGRLVHSEHQQFPGVCYDCVQPALEKMRALTALLRAGELTPEEHNAALADVSLDPLPAVEA